MSGTTRVHCRKCGKHKSEVGRITWEGYCVKCGREEYDSNALQMRARSGPNWRKWRRAMAASVGGVLIEDVRR